MSVHIETISATETVVEVNAAGTTIGDDVFDQPTLVISDLDSALVIAGTVDQLDEIIRRAHEGLCGLRDQMNRPEGG